MAGGGVALLLLSVRMLAEREPFNGLYALAGCLFFFGASCDPINILRTVIGGRVDLQDGDARIGKIGRALMWAAAVVAVVAWGVGYVTTGRLP